MPIALITGATSGIGRATAERFAQAGYRLILTGRRAERLAKLEAELATDVLTLAFDVRERETVKRVLLELPNDWQTIDLLVNNAGLARGKEAVPDNTDSDWEDMIDTNIKGMAYVAREVARGMRERGGGQIINMGSTAGKQAYAGGAMYCATKHAVDAFTKGLRLDMLGTGVKVSAIHPGLVETEFSNVRFHGDDARADDTYTGMTPLTGADVAEAIYFMATRPAHVNVADLVLMPLAQGDASTVVRA